MAITEEQRERRKRGIFASDVARIMTGQGVQVALEKMGEIEPDNLDGIPNVERGNVLEAPVLDAYERIKKPTQLIRSPDTIYHPQMPWLGCHLDGLAHFGDHARVVEAKAFDQFAKSGWGEPGTDQVPMERMWQCMAQMAVTGAPYADIPITFATVDTLTEFITRGTVSIEIYTIQSNADLIEFMISECEKVWRCVETGELPTPVNVGDAELIYRKSTEGKVVEADDDIYALYTELQSHRLALKSAEGAKAATEARIKEFMADAQELRYGGKVLATWKNNKAGEQFNKDAFKKTHPAIYAEFTTTKQGNRPFLIKE